MNNFFGRKKEVPQQPVEDLSTTSMRLNQNMDDTQLKLNAIEAQLKAQLKVVQETRNPTQKAQARKKATMLLKKKKMYENHLNTLANTQMTVESANLDCEVMRDNMNVMRVMKNTIQIQKDTLHAMGGIDKMYDVLDDMQDLREEQQELNDEFQRNYEVDVEDGELDAELDELDYQMRVEMDNEGMKAPEGGQPIKNSDEAALEEALK